MGRPRHAVIAFAIHGPIERRDLPGLCRRVRAVLEEAPPAVALCDVSPLVASDAVAVDALARLQLLAGRVGCQVRLRQASADLLQLLAFMGLRDVVPELLAETRRQAEEREEHLGVQEEAEIGDLPV